MHELIRSNKRRSALVIVVFCAVFVAIGWIVGVTVGGGWTLTVLALALVGVVRWVVVVIGGDRTESKSSASGRRN